MELTKKDKTVKYLVYCLVLLLCALFQNVNGLFFEIGSARCFFIIPAAVILGMGEDEKTSALLGLFGGFIWDITSSQHMGFNCIFLMLVCFFSASLVTYLVRDAFVVNVVCAVVASFLYCLLYWLFFMVIKHSDGSVATIYNFYLPCAIYTSIVSPILYLLLRPLKRKLNKSSED